MSSTTTDRAEGGTTSAGQSPQAGMEPNVTVTVAPSISICPICLKKVNSKSMSKHKTKHENLLPPPCNLLERCPRLRLLSENIFSSVSSFPATLHFFHSPALVAVEKCSALLPPEVNTLSPAATSSLLVRSAAQTSPPRGCTPPTSGAEIARWQRQPGVNKKPFACPFQDRQFQNQDRLTDSFRNFYL